MQECGEAMPVTVAFLSQKGGVGKSSLARSLAVVAADVGLKVTLVDLDPQQRTLMRWQNSRQQHGLLPCIKVEDFCDPQVALDAPRDADLVVLDLPGQLSDAVAAVARQAQFIVQPTSPSVDDLHPSMLVFQALERVQIPRDRLAFALCRVLSDKEAEATRTYLEEHGYAVLRGFILERLAYRDALNLGRALCETRQQTLNAYARTMMLDILNRVLTEACNKSKKKPQRRSRERSAPTGSAETLAKAEKVS